MWYVPIKEGRRSADTRKEGLTEAPGLDCCCFESKERLTVVRGYSFGADKDESPSVIDPIPFPSRCKSASS